MPRVQVMLRTIAACAVLLSPFHSDAQTLPDSPGVMVASYPEVLHRMPILRPQGVTTSGEVQVDVTLNPQGAVTDAHVVIGPEELRKTVLASVLEWHFAATSNTARVTVTFADPRADVTIQSGTRTPTFVPPPPPMPPPIRPPFVFSQITFNGLSPELEQQVRGKLGFKEDQTVNKTLAEISATVQKVDPHLTIGISQIAATLSPVPNGPLTLRISLPVTAAITVGPGYASGGVSRAPMPIPSGTLRVSTEMLRILSKVPPAYPPIARQSRAQGTVKLDTLIGADGRVIGLTTLEGPAILQQAAMEAVRQWVFQPFVSNGNAVPVMTTIEVTFTLVQ